MGFIRTRLQQNFCPNGFLSTCGFFGDSVIARFAKDHKPPYGVQASFGIEVQPFKDAVLDITGLHVRGVHLGSFYNVNQPPQNGCPATLTQLARRRRIKNLTITWLRFRETALRFFHSREPRSRTSPSISKLTRSGIRNGTGCLSTSTSGQATTSDMGISYTWSKGIDNGPNPSFVLIPQDSCCFNKERAVSSDSVSNRFVANATLYGPEHKNAFVNGWQLGTIVTLESPHYFTKFAGST